MGNPSNRTNHSFFVKLDLDEISRNRNRNFCERSWRGEEEARGDNFEEKFFVFRIQIDSLFDKFSIHRRIKGLFLYAIKYFFLKSEF